MTIISTCNVQQNVNHFHSSGSAFNVSVSIAMITSQAESQISTEPSRKVYDIFS